MYLLLKGISTTTHCWLYHYYHALQTVSLLPHIANCIITATHCRLFHYYHIVQTVSLHCSNVLILPRTSLDCVLNSKHHTDTDTMYNNRLHHHPHTAHLTIASLCSHCKTHSLYPQTAQPDTAAACSTLYATHWSDLQSMQFSCLPVMGVRYWKIQ